MRLAITMAAAAFCVASAAVPVEWTVDVSKVQPQTFEAYHGETLDLRASMVYGGRPLAIGSGSATFLWQTNGMGNAWWRQPAELGGDGVVRASFTPSMDTGSDVVTFFFGVTTSDGTSYRPSGSIRMRRSPGASPESADLPRPGGVLDFAVVQVQNAPWATMSAVDAAISAATAPLCTLEAAREADAVVSNALMEAIGAIQVPSLAGYATEAWTRELVSGVSPSVDLSGYATTAYAEQVAAAAAAGVQVPNLAGYATEAWTRNYVSTNRTDVDLSGYATRTYADQAAAAAAAGVQVPNLAGYATEAWTRSLVDGIRPTVDLSGYATRDYAEQVAADAAAGVQVPSLAGYATETFVRDAMRGGFVQREVTTILATEDGLTWQDATGVVWQVSTVYDGTPSADVEGIIFDKWIQIDEMTGLNKIYFYWDGVRCGHYAFPPQPGWRSYTIAAGEWMSEEWDKHPMGEGTFSITFTRAPRQATNAVRRVVYESSSAPSGGGGSSGLWDGGLEVQWSARMNNGQLYYIAVTNVNMEAH